LRLIFAQLAGLSAHEAADALNSRSVATPTGARGPQETVLPIREGRRRGGTACE
jgi:hypothetical protein